MVLSLVRALEQVSNLFLGILGLPWVNGAIPHSPLHARALAEVEEVYVDGSFQEKYVQFSELVPLLRRRMYGRVETFLNFLVQKLCSYSFFANAELFESMKLESRDLLRTY